jgi:hypothetical protein
MLSLCCVGVSLQFVSVGLLYFLHIPPEEVQKLDRKTRKMLTIHGQHHPRADIDRLYVLRKEGGRGLIQVEGAYIAETLSLVEYVESVLLLLLLLLEV